MQVLDNSTNPFGFKSKVQSYNYTEAFIAICFFKSKKTPVVFIILSTLCVEKLLNFELPFVPPM